MRTIVEQLEDKGVKATANRELVLRAFDGHPHPLSLGDLERLLFPMDKSSISRVLKLFIEHHVLHFVDDGSGVQKYEICHGKDCCDCDEMHIHFHCEECGETFCFESIHVPMIEIPDGFEMSTVNYVVKGLCPICAEKAKRKGNIKKN